MDSKIYKIILVFTLALFLFQSSEAQETNRFRKYIGIFSNSPNGNYKVTINAQNGKMFGADPRGSAEIVLEMNANFHLKNTNIRGQFVELKNELYQQLIIKDNGYNIKLTRQYIAQTGNEILNKNAWVRFKKIEQVGFSKKRLELLNTYCKTINTTGLMGIYKGKVFFEYGDIKHVSYIASARKSVLSMIYGKYVVNGTIDLHWTLKNLNMDDLGGLIPIEKEATIGHLITARSGVYHAASYRGDNLAFAPARGSMKPGSYFLYNNWDFNAAGAAFELTTGKNIFDVVQQELAIPLDMQDFYREIHKKEGNLTHSKYPAYPMYFSTRDMARLGHLMLDNGKYKGKQIIPEEWIKESVRIITPPEEMYPNYIHDEELGYGYMWWVWAGRNIREELIGAYTAAGAHGQFITVIPKLNMVIAHKTAIPPNQDVSMYEYKKIVEQLIDSKIK